MVHWIGIFAGFVLLAATAVAAISFGAGWQSPQSLVIAAIAFGMAVGSLMLSAKEVQARRMLWVMLGAILICAECFALLLTADRLVKTRNEAQRPQIAAEAKYRRLSAKAASLRAELKTLETSPRLIAALNAQKSVMAAAVREAAKPKCGANCRAISEKSIEAASNDVERARVDLDNRRSDVNAKLVVVGAALEKAKNPFQARSLASGLGLTGLGFTMLWASLGSLAANGLACVLIGVGAHCIAARREAYGQVAVPASPEPATLFADVKQSPDVKQLAAVKQEDAAQLSDIDTFKQNLRCMEMFIESELESSEGSASSFAELRGVYLVWCVNREKPPMGEREFQRILKGIAKTHGVPVVNGHKGPALVGVKCAANA